MSKQSFEYQHAIVALRAFLCEVDELVEMHVSSGLSLEDAATQAILGLARTILADERDDRVELCCALEVLLDSLYLMESRADAASHEPLRRVQGFVLDHVAADLSVAALARKAGMSPRNFARLFLRDVGVTPAVFVEHARVDVARRLLEQTTLGLEAVAEQAGFGRVETLCRAFARSLSINASEYRKRFRTGRR